jgi:hypothetical protein
MPRRNIKQILRAYDRGGRTAASRMSQRTVARASFGPYEDGAADVSGTRLGSEGSRSGVVVPFP